MIVVVCMLLSGAAFYLSQGIDNLWLLAWIAPAPLLWLAYGRTPAWQVVLASAVAFFAGQVYSIQSYANTPALFVLSDVLPQTILFPVAIAFARLTKRRSTRIATLFAFPACWTALEYLLGLVSPNGSWGSLAYSQVSAPILIQSASFCGLYGVTFLLCLFANTSAMAARGALRERLAIGLGIGLCALNVAFGAVRLALPRAATVRVAALEHGDLVATVAHHLTAGASEDASKTYARAIQGLAARDVKLAVTPEGGIVSNSDWRPQVLAPLVAVSKQTGIQIVTGTQEVLAPGDLAFSVLPDGTVQSYAKRHPVPFLEAKYTPGRQSGWLGDGRAMEICKDMDFPRMIRADAAKGVRLMAVPAGDFVVDAWIHARMAVMRGVEDGFSIIRSANDGLLTATDAEGRMVAGKMTRPHGMNILIADLPLGPGPTIYVQIGDVFSWLCVAATLGIGAVSIARREAAC